MKTIFSALVALSFLAGAVIPASAVSPSRSSSSTPKAVAATIDN